MAGADPASELAPQSISSPGPTRDDDDDEDDPTRAGRDGLIDGLIDVGLIEDGVVVVDGEADGEDAPSTSTARGFFRRRRAGDEATDHSPPSSAPESPGNVRKRPAGPTSRHSTKKSRRRPSSPARGAHSSRISEDVVRVATHSPGRAGGVRSNGTISEPSSDVWDFLGFLDFSAERGAGSVVPTRTSEGADVPTRFLALTVTAYAVAGSNPVSVATHPSHTGTSSATSPSESFGVSSLALVAVGVVR